MLITAVRANMKQAATRFQIALLNLRMKVETHFRMLKVVYGLVTCKRFSAPTLMLARGMSQASR